MSENNKTYRIRTEINSETPFYLNLNLNQDYKNFEILSLNLDSESLYKMFTSNYGCVVGRVLANDALGIPNAKISIFIPTKESDDIDPVLKALYPYETTLDKNDEHIRYNTLPDEIVNECHQSVGTFPNKRLVLDDNNVLEIFEKYYKYTTVSNASGDYMIYGVPVGEQTLHVDIDLSDIGELSQRPIDMMYKGYDKTQFESSSMFNKSTDIDKLTQIFSQNLQVYVKPFWGDDESQEVSITRCDVSIQYKFEPTCIFIGSIITDSGYAGFSKKCVPSPEMGVMGNLVGTSGTIEIIRKTQGNNVESLIIQGTQLIDGSGKWCFQIPMNLDFVGTDEYGNRIATNDPNKGVPTRTRVRFRISSSHEKDEYDDLHISKVLVPHNPKTLREIDYAFGSKTLDNEEASLSFRDLFKDNVYTVKSYIPRIQKGNGQRTEKFSGIKNVTDNNGNNSIPYNNMRVNITFMFILQCAILKMLIMFITFINKLFSSEIWYKLWSVVCTLVEVNATTLKKLLTCITLGDSICPDMEGWYYAPGCEGDEKETRQIKTLGGWLIEKIFGDNDSGLDIAELTPMTPLSRTLNNKQWADREGVDFSSIDFGNDDGEASCISNQLDYLMQCVEIHLAMEHNVVQFDFYNDWLNGTIYIPKWFGTIKKKRSYLFGLIKRPEKIQACMEEWFSKTRNLTQQCALSYKDNGNGTYNTISSKLGCKDDDFQKCHKRAGRKYIKILGKKNGGVVHKEETIRTDNVYYLRPMELYDERLIYLFATDIVLLGSINQNNIHGVPYVFNGLTASSYKFPTLLAMTNLQEESTQYTACSGTRIDTQGVSPTYSQDGDNDDGPEYMYTEFAGLDWGFVGPGQGNSSKSKEVNKLETLYFPGGHFLGISCFNTETNIKSCVNLSRACEIGTSFSQFTEIPYETEGDSDLKYIQYNANGLISRREITDSDYRNIFATLNFNELRTIPNEETLQRENLFISNFSYNFDGVLVNKVKNSDYTSERTLKPISKAPDGGNNKAYGTAFEVYDSDYYKFRFGTHRKTNRQCFAGEEINTDGFVELYMPIYNNSFYFYFGIENGGTAYDKLYEDYYSVCTNDINSIPSIEISDITRNDYCELNEGTATINLSQVNTLYKIYFSYRESDNEEYRPYILNQIEAIDNTPTMSPSYCNSTSYCPATTLGGEESSLISLYKTILFKDLLNGDYIIYIQTINDEYEYSVKFSINQKLATEDPEINETIETIITQKFIAGVYKNIEKRGEGNVDKGGFISLRPMSNDIEAYRVIHINNNMEEEIICDTEIGNNNTKKGFIVIVNENEVVVEYKFYVPYGDEKYYVDMKLNCPKDSYYSNRWLRVPYSYIVVFSDLPVDYYFTNNKMEGRILRKLLTDGEIALSSLTNYPLWYIDDKLKGLNTNINNDNRNNDRYTQMRLALIEYAIVYNESLFKNVLNTDETKEINMGISSLPEYHPNYNIYGDSVSLEVSSGGKKTININRNEETPVSTNEFPLLLLPTTSIKYNETEKNIESYHNFKIYFDKLYERGIDSNPFNVMLYDYELEIIETNDIEEISEDNIIE